MYSFTHLYTGKTLFVIIMVWDSVIKYEQYKEETHGYKIILGKKLKK